MRVQPAAGGSDRRHSWTEFRLFRQRIPGEYIFFNSRLLPQASNFETVDRGFRKEQRVFSGCGKLNAWSKKRQGTTSVVPKGRRSRIPEGAEGFQWLRKNSTRGARSVRARLQSCRKGRRSRIPEGAEGFQWLRKNSTRGARSVRARLQSCRKG